MKLRVLGCSGGIGGRHLRTTSLLIDHDILIDAGTGVAELSISELAAIDHVFLTHSHLDHIAALPLLLDTVVDRRDTPVTVYGLPAVLDSLRQHVFNWTIWPDFACIPDPSAPMLRYQSLTPLDDVVLAGRRILPLPVDHTVPAVGYAFNSGGGTVVFSGDTGPCEAFWQAVNQLPSVRHLIVECAFSDQEMALAKVSKHLCPTLLAAELQRLQHACEIYVTHLKPGLIEQTMEEIERSLSGYSLQMLQNNQLIEF